MNRVLLAALFFCLALAPAHAQRLIGEGDSWRYLTGNNALPGDWAQPGFNDGVAPWLSGNSGFGYGDGDDATVLNMSTYVSVFTRKTFTVPNPATVSHLNLAMDYDDGFVAYLN